MKIAVTSLENKKSGDIELNDSVFGVAVRGDLLARMVNYQLARRRAGTHKVKERGEVSGSTRKIKRQKGGGARHGSIRANIFRGGGIVHGPRVRDHATDLPKKVRRLALKTALSAKLAEGRLVVVDSLDTDEVKTSVLAKKLSTLGWSSALIVGGESVNANFVRATRNIPCVDVLPSQGANVYDILRRDLLVLTKDAVQVLEARLS